MIGLGPLTTDAAVGRLPQLGGGAAGGGRPLDLLAETEAAVRRDTLNRWDMRRFAAEGEAPAEANREATPRAAANININAGASILGGIGSAIPRVGRFLGAL